MAGELAQDIVLAVSKTICRAAEGGTPFAELYTPGGLESQGTRQG